MTNMVDHLHIKLWLLFILVTCCTAHYSYSSVNPWTVIGNCNTTSQMFETCGSGRGICYRPGVTSKRQSRRLRCAISPACGSPPIDPYGTYIPRGSGRFLDIAELKCRPGYRVAINARSVVCLANGAWSKPSGSCLPIDPTRSECPDGWVSYKRSCYFFGRGARSFKDAEALCVQYGSHLVNVGSAAESLFLADQLSGLNAPLHWIGLTDAAYEGTYRWVDTGAVATYFNWGDYEPTGGTYSNCVAISAPLYFKWTDESCDNYYPPICEKKKQDVCYY